MKRKTVSLANTGKRISRAVSDIDKRGRIGRKIARDVLHLQAMAQIADSSLAIKAKISPGTLSVWRRKLKDGAPMYPQYPTVEMILNAIGQTLTISARNS